MSAIAVQTRVVADFALHVRLTDPEGRQRVVVFAAAQACAGFESAAPELGVLDSVTELLRSGRIRFGVLTGDGKGQPQAFALHAIGAYDPPPAAAILLQHGTWPPAKSAWARDSRGAIWAGCPGCAGSIPITAPPHEVSPRGEVRPNLRCDCGQFRAVVALDGFDPPGDGACATCTHVHGTERCMLRVETDRVCACLAGTDAWAPAAAR